MEPLDKNNMEKSAATEKKQNKHILFFSLSHK